MPRATARGVARLTEITGHPARSCRDWAAGAAMPTGIRRLVTLCNRLEAGGIDWRRWIDDEDDDARRSKRAD